MSGTETVKYVPQPGQVNRLITDKKIKTVHNLISQNRHIKIVEIASKINVRVGYAQNICERLSPSN